MITTSLVLLAHYPERAKNVEQIVNAFLQGTIPPDEIIVFIDNNDITLNLPDMVKVIRSEKSVSVMARLFASTFSSGSHIMLLDTDLLPKADTLEKLIAYANKYPKSVLGHEGVVLKDSNHPYTDTFTHPVKEPEECDVLIRSWFVPRTVIADGLKLFWSEGLPDKYADDLIICLANRFIQGHKNYIVPIEFDELSDGGRGQCKSGEHYVYRDKICKQLIRKYR